MAEGVVRFRTKICPMSWSACYCRLRAQFCAYTRKLTMAKKTTTPEEAPAPGGILATAAKSLGAVAGKIAALAGAKAEAPAKPKAPKIPKLVSKKKSRLPRKQKKALKTAES